MSVILMTGMVYSFRKSLFEFSLGNGHAMDVRSGAGKHAVAGRVEELQLRALCDAPGRVQNTGGMEMTIPRLQVAKNRSLEGQLSGCRDAGFDFIPDHHNANVCLDLRAPETALQVGARFNPVIVGWQDFFTVFG
jgi:hypothetical protein